MDTAAMLDQLENLTEAELKKVSEMVYTLQNAATTPVVQTVSSPAAKLDESEESN